MTNKTVTAEERSMTEDEMRNAKVPWPKTEQELLDYIRPLVTQQHDYGTCVYAMSMAATAAFQYVAGILGVTGFQASCADMDILKRTRSLEVFSIIDWSNLLYPQYEYKFGSIHPDTWKWLQDKAAENLKDRAAHPNVIAHWQSIVDGVVPFGLTVRKD